MGNRYTEQTVATLEKQQEQIEQIEMRLKEYREEVARAAVELNQHMEELGDQDYSLILAKQMSSSRVSKWIWQVITILLLFFIFIFSAALVSDIQAEGFTSDAVISDVIMVIVTVFIAFFTVGQSKKVRQAERESREVMMKLARNRDNSLNG